MIGDKEFFGLLCDDCYNSPERKTEEAEKQTRTKRRAKSDRLRDILSSVIPPLYRDAHIFRLPKIIKNKFFALSPSEGLFLSGAVGCGKTFSLYAFVRYFICKGSGIIFYRFEDLLCDIRASYSGDSGIDETKLLNRLKNVRRLFIDDLGTTAGLNLESDFSLRTLFNVLDHRINFMLPTFLSSNKSLEELGKSFDGRILSRIAGSCLILNLSGKDKRLDNKIRRAKL